MTPCLRLKIVKNKANKQFNLNPKKSDLPPEIRNKMDYSRFLKINLEDIEFE